MRRTAAAVCAIGLLMSSPAYAVSYAAPPRTVANCVATADAKAQEALGVKQGQLLAVELSVPEIALFNAIIGGIFGDAVDVVTVFVYPDHHGEFVIGSQRGDFKCSAPAFVLSPDQVAQLMRAIEKTGV